MAKSQLIIGLQLINKKMEVNRKLQKLIAHELDIDPLSGEQVELLYSDIIESNSRF